MSGWQDSEQDRSSDRKCAAPSVLGFLPSCSFGHLIFGLHVSVSLGQALGFVSSLDASVCHLGDGGLQWEG